MVSGLKKTTYSEKELVEGCAQNDRKYQEALYRRYFPTMIAMCLRRTDDKETAMEIVNDGFLRVFKKIGTFGFKGSLEGWIRKLVFHALADYFRANARYTQFLVFEDHDESVNAEGLNNMYADDILKAIDTLPPMTKQVFCLYALEGFSHEEVAQSLGMSEGTSKWHLSTGRAKLRQWILEQQNNNSSKNHAG